MLPERVPPNRAWIVVALCGMVVIVEGYDLIVYGALLPSLLKEPHWSLTRADAGTIGSYVYAGMLIGALAGGRLCDRFGRRPFINASVAWFAVWTFACSQAHTPWQLGLFRFLAGLGMGAVIPAALAIAKEYAPGRTALVSTVLMGGVPLGGTAAALLAQNILPTHGWRTMFVIGGIVSALILIACLALMRESTEFEQPATPVRELQSATRAWDLFARQNRTLTVLFAAATFTNMLTWYGVNTWLTVLMQELHYPLTSALRFTMTLNLGAVAGSYLVALAATRFGTRPMAAICALLTGAGVLGLALHPSVTAVLMLLVALVGIGAHSSLTMLLASVADAYPTRLRGSAIGTSNGLGRAGAILAPSLGGWILAAGLGPSAVFLVFALSALCSAAVLFALVALGAKSTAAGGRRRVPAAA